MLVVTTNDIHGWDLQRVCGEVYGVHVRASSDPGNPAEGRTAALTRMLEHARVKGGNAVVGMRLDSAALGDGRVELCAYGTAVVAAPVDDGARQTATSLGYGQPGASSTEDTTPPQATEQPQYAQQQYQQQGYPQQPQQYPQGYPGPQ
jgi:uncharacterized protein YbjQ (UPF0145 family)